MIPPRLHFCWIGPALPWACAFAVLSAAARGGMDEVVLHHTDALDDDAPLRAVLGAPGVRLERVDAVACLGGVGEALGLGDWLARLYGGLGAAAMRADVLRAAILFREGGIYLDLDTLTVASLRPLLGARAFVGSEFIVWPQRARESRSPVLLARHVGLDLARKAARRLPGGWRWFRRIEGRYPCAVNNAAMGCEAGSALLADCLRAMAAVPGARLAQRTALGPALLQGVVAAQAQDAGGDAGGLVVHPPRVFSPLPPEVSEHWFRLGGAVRLDAALSADTRVAHWYASVRTRALVALISPGSVLANRDRQLYSALAADCVPGLAALGGGDGPGWKARALPWTRQAEVPTIRLDRWKGRQGKQPLDPASLK